LPYNGSRLIRTKDVPFAVLNPRMILNNTSPDRLYQRCNLHSGIDNAGMSYEEAVNYLNAKIG
jgi:hypothetical protein